MSDNEKLEQLMAIHTEQMFRIAYYYTKDLQIAEDIVQDVFIKFYHQKDYEERGEMTPDRGFVYIYYNYDETDKRIFQMTTNANEFYTYYNGYVYHIGYQLDGDPQEVQEKMATIVRAFILGD
ncbi:sigma factor [Lysinibacillus fusiformis]|uniref:RNA polymerase sigma factor n=1 Tax=Lysinibacillus fusiformis TaxID=28031 RepID=UPI002EACF775|nr:sigma factor [Lysinibacillus fusiformis]